VSELARAAPSPPQEALERRARFSRLLHDTRAETQRYGDHRVDDVLAEIAATTGTPSRAAECEIGED
jgi:hypothetical protein